MQLNDYVPISVATLVPTGDSFDFDLFRLDPGASGFVLYRGASYPFGRDDLERLRDSGINKLYISSGARHDYQAYLRELAGFGEQLPTRTTGAHVIALSQVVRDILGDAFLTRDADQAVDAANQCGAAIADTVCHNEQAHVDLIRVLQHDYATFTHSTNVAVYASILGKALGHDDQSVAEIAIAGLLHDLGKLEIDDQILCKPGKLDEMEFREVRRHPTIGFRRLSHRTDLSEAQLMMAYQHHERIDGNGYPVGLVGDEIHPWAKLCAVVDVFEALTSHRPYRKPMTKKLAMEIMQRESGQAFSPDVLSCWMEIAQSL